MENINLQHLNLKNLINFFLCLLPASFIAGNLVINLNLFLIIFFSLILFGKKIFSLRLYFFDKLLIFLSCYILFVALVNGVNYSEVGESYWLNKIMLKSLFFFKIYFFLFCY